MNCSVPDCTKTADKRGWCGMHYRRWQRHGDPSVNLRPDMVIGTNAERWWAKVDRRGPDECWPWKGSCQRESGYGIFIIQIGPKETKGTTAHRFGWELVNGPMPEGCEGSHTCDNPPCCNPSHTVAETHAENLHRSTTVQFKKNAAKTHCKHGHPFEGRNIILRLRKDGGYSRECRLCLHEAVRRYQAKKSGQSAEAQTNH